MYNNYQFSNLSVVTLYINIKKNKVTLFVGSEIHLVLINCFIFIRNCSLSLQLVIAGNVLILI